MIKRRSRRSSNGASRDRGAVFIEFALLLPVLLLFAMGIVEYGMGWRAANDVNAAARDGARSGTSASAYATADRSVLVSIANNLASSGDLDGVEKIIVYKASSANGQVPGSCLAKTNPSGSASSPGFVVGVGGVCNVYGPGQLTYLLNGSNASNNGPWVNSAGTGCDGSDLDAPWCPAIRNHSLTSNSFDYMGVYVKLKHSSITGFGFGDQMIERTAVFSLEPKFGGE